MSKLPKAPLLEVIFELRWNVSNAEELNKSQFLMGELYSYLKEKYPVKETSQPIFGQDIPGILIGTPMYKYRMAEEKYPLIQIGPGIISLNQVNDGYFWEMFNADINEMKDAFFKAYGAVNDELFAPRLSYFDFIDLQGISFIDFVNTNMNLKIHPNLETFKDAVSTTTLSISKNIDIGQLVFNIGTNTINGRDGIIMQTQINGASFNQAGDINAWTNKAHEICSSLFKEITNGNLYDSFN